MPNKDKTGPQGEGPKTGRGLGDCGNKNVERSVSGDRRGLSRKNSGRGIGKNRVN